MEIRKLQEQYLVFCKYRKELDDKTLKAYRIDLRQYFEWVEGEEPGSGDREVYYEATYRFQAKDSET